MELAKAAEKGRPITVGKGQLVRTDITGTSGYCLPSGCELSPRERTYLYDPHLGRFVDPNNRVSNPDGSELMYPAGLEHPTIEWLASLPSDPDMLLARIRSELRRPVPERPEDQMIWTVVRRIYLTCEIVLAPALRAALLRVLAKMPALTVRQLVVNGRTLIAIGHDIGNAAEETLFDPATGHAVGFAVDPLTLGVVTVYPGGQRAIEGGHSDQSTWKQTLT